MGKQTREYVEQAIQSGTAIRFEEEHEGIWYDTIIHPVFNTHARIGKIAILVRDITRRKRMEEDLRHYIERLSILYEIDHAVLASRSAEAIAQATLDQVRRLVPCIGGAVLLFDSETGDAIVLVAEVNGKTVAQRGTRLPLEEFKDIDGHIKSLRQGRVHMLEDTFAIPEPPRVIEAVRAWGMRSLLSIPLVVEGESVGFFSLGGESPGALAPRYVGIAGEVARSVAIAIQQAQLLEQLSVSRERLRRLAQRIVSTQEEERQRLSRTLHDEAGQALIALKISLELIGQDLPAEYESLRQRTSDAIALTDATMEQIRLLARDLHPPALDTVGLGPTLEGFCQGFAKRTQLPIDYVGLELPAVPTPISICLYRFLQEALTNVAKHARASQVRVVLNRDYETVSLSVEDDGRGFDKLARLMVSGWSMGMGLMGMQERLKSLGGQLEVESTPGRGTRLVAHIPFQERYCDTSTEDTRHHRR
jgi:signal transduction histidine kinase